MKSTQVKQRYILAQLSDLTLVFPSSLVEEIMIVEREQILHLPFYDSTIMGCVHTTSGVMPIVSLAQIYQVKIINLKKITIVRLNEKAGKQVRKIGLAVERVTGSQNKEQLPEYLFTENLDKSTKMQLFNPDIIDVQIWQPKQW